MVDFFLKLTALTILAMLAGLLFGGLTGNPLIAVSVHLFCAVLNYRKICLTATEESTYED